MNKQIIKHDLLKNLYLLEDHFNPNDLFECQNLLLFLSNIIPNLETSNIEEEDILIAIKKIFEKSAKEIKYIQNNIKNETIKEKINDNDKNLNYIDHSYSFRTLFSARLFDCENSQYSYQNYRG